MLDVEQDKVARWFVQCKNIFLAYFRTFKNLKESIFFSDLGGETPA